MIYQLINLSEVSQINNVIPDPCSPMYTKMVVCTSNNLKNADIICSSAFSGYLTCASLRYSNIDQKSVGFINYNNDFTSNLLSPYILSSMFSIPVSWLSCGYEFCCLLTTTGKIMT